MGISFEEHDSARKLFQNDVLPTLYQVAIKFMDGFLKNLPTSKISLEIFKNALSLLSKTLLWDFSTTIYLKHGYEKDMDSQLNPNDEFWKKTLSDRNLMILLLKVHVVFRFESELTHSIRQNLLQLSLISTTCFSSVETQISYLTSFIEGILEFISKSFQDIKNSKINFGQEMYDFSRMILRIIVNFKPETFYKMQGIMKFFQAFVEMSSKLITLTGKSDDEWIFESIDNILACWCALIPEQTLDVPRDLRSCIKRGCFTVFVAFFEEKIKDHEERFDTEYLLNDQLVSISTLARQDVVQSLSGIFAKLQNIFGKFELSIGNGSVSDHLFDEMEWILTFTGYVLADESDGETPIVPDEIEVYCEEAKTSTENLVLKLFNTIAAYSELESKLIMAKKKNLLSPLIARKLIWFFKRWTRTYLIPDTSCQLLLTYYGETQHGGTIIDFLMTKIRVNLFLWQDEPELVQDTLDLFKMLVSKLKVAQYLVTKQIWGDLILEDSKSFGWNVNDLIKGSLTECLVMGTYSSNEKEIEKFLFQIFSSLQNQFQSIIKNDSFSKNTQKPEVMVQISYCLNKYRGIARASVNYNIKFIFKFFTQTNLFENLVQLSQIYRDVPEIYMEIFIFFKECVEFQNMHLSLTESVYLYKACIELMKIYTKHHAGRIYSTKVDKDTNENKYLDLLIHLEILESLTSKDFLDLSGDDNSKNLDLSQVIFSGIDALLPLFTVEYLQIPAICSKYFSLLTYMTENYTSKVMKLSPQLFKQLLQTVDFGMKHHDVQIAKCSFDAILAILEYSIQNMNSQNEYIEMVDYFLQSIFGILLYGKFSTELLENMSVTLFGFLVWNNKRFLQLVEMIIENEKDNKDRMRAAFHVLMNGIDLKWDKKNKRLFTENLNKFAGIARAFTFKR